MHKRLDTVGLVKNLLFDSYDVEHTLSLQHVAEVVVEALNNWEKTAHPTNPVGRTHGC